MFEGIIGGFPGDGWQFGHPVLEEGSDILDHVIFLLEHVGKLIISDEDRHGTV